MPRCFLLLFLSLVTAVAAEPTPVARHGQLRTDGARIVGEHGEVASLAGVSLFWSQWMGQFWNESCIEWLRRDWQVDVVRAAVGVAKGSGYLADPGTEQARLERVVDAAIANGLYVIIDWHDHDAHHHAAEAEAFFQGVARKYGHQPNVIYEIYNEPLNVSWAKDVKPYAERIVAAIRAIDPDNLILVGSPRWSQDVDVAADDPLVATNVAYALHFYAGSHRQSLRDKAEQALNKGVALFVSEYGTCDANGDGPVDVASTEAWLAFMRKWGLSHCNWAVSDKKESASIVRPGASPQGGWREEELTESGKFVRGVIRAWHTKDPASDRPAGAAP